MNKNKLIIFCIIAGLFLNSCKEILEPVSLSNIKRDVVMDAGQEEFKINFKCLTFNKAKQANKTQIEINQQSARPSFK